MVWDLKKGREMEEIWRKILKERNGGTPSDAVPNSLWKEMRDAGERRSGIKVQEHKTIQFPFPGDSCAPFPWGIPWFSLPRIPFLPGSITTKPFQHGTLRFPGFSAAFPRGSGIIQGQSHKSIIPTGKNSIFFHPTTLQPGKGHLWLLAPCGAIREWDRGQSPANLLPAGKRLFHPRHIPGAHGRVTNLPGRKKVWICF